MRSPEVVSNRPPPHCSPPAGAQPSHAGKKGGGACRGCTPVAGPPLGAPFPCVVDSRGVVLGVGGAAAPCGGGGSGTTTSVCGGVRDAIMAIEVRCSSAHKHADCAGASTASNTRAVAGLTFTTSAGDTCVRGSGAAAKGKGFRFWMHLIAC